MSVDWFIQRFEKHQPVKFDISRLNEDFAKLRKREHLVEGTIWWDLDCGPSMTAGEKGMRCTSSILINRPALVPELLEAIFELLKDVGMILFSGDLDTPFVANRNTRRQLPGKWLRL